MARRKLTIVVTCTDRKSGAPSESLMARSLPSGTVSERVNDWTSRIAVARPTSRLLDLYKGEGWTQTKRLAATAQRTGFVPEIVVASAGLGLRSVNERGPSYAATFARGHQDSVVSSASDAMVWWSHLPHTVAPGPDLSSIWVLSDSYAQAMQEQIQTLDPDSALVFGGAASTPDALRVRSDRSLRPALGGTMTSLNTRMAIRWLELSGGHSPTSEVARKAWADWARHAQQTERYHRRPLPDDTIRQLILEMLGRQPTLSKTQALKDLRESGIACEQRRFSRLFKEACRA